MNAALNELGSQLFGWFGQLSIELAALAVLVLSRQSPVADQVAGLAPPVVGGRAAQAARRRRGQLSLYALHAVGTISRIPLGITSHSHLSSIQRCK